ncbi:MULTISPECIES: hypothetical protein [Gammaproteobacteria]|nr:hypothetical protein [Proteus mirabilis]WGY29378.1 hypothetical protein QJS45_05025 [Proteus mirabilis]HDU8313870.1 hypothetical protein [Proteus mirabilis]HEK0502203.1 hypothetical protein [Proteus mirabilis]
MKHYLESLRLKEKSLIDGHQPSITCFDFCSECVLLQDNDFLQLTEYIKENPSEIEGDLIDQIKLECKNEIQNIRLKLENSILTDKEYVKAYLFYKPKIDRANTDLHINSIEDFINNYNREAFESFYYIGMKSIFYKLIYAKALSYENLKENAIYYRISGLLFDKYKREYKKNNFDYKSLMVSDEVKKKIKDLYGNNHLCRYELFKVDIVNQSLTKNVFPYISDKKHNGTYLIIDSKNKNLIDLFNDLIANGYIQDISFKIDSVTNEIIMLEERMFGQKFSFNLDELPDLSRFFDINAQNDNVWVTVEKEENKFSITFEETLEDTFYDKELNVVTNLVHVEVTKKNGSDVINHIDHEYIVYDLDTYFKRLDDPAVKGGHKIKTFKIDNAKIPINYKYQNINAFFLIVYESMNKKDLVREYFENIR